MKRIIFLLLLYSLNPFIPDLKAQHIIWDVGFDGFLDNREYFNDYSTHQTIFGSRINACAGIQINRHHIMMAGFNYLYEFGSLQNDFIPDVTIYYNGHQGPVNFYLGSFPRHNILDYPRVMLNDTLRYYRPNIEGCFLSLNLQGISQDIWLDWTSRQTHDTKETFLAGTSGAFQKGIFLIKNYLLMYHRAKSAAVINNGNIRDNGGLSLMIGMDAENQFIFDSITFVLGPVISYDRVRNEYEFRYARGLRYDLEFWYRNMGLKGSYYHGNGLMFCFGEGMYTSKSYARVDFCYDPVRLKNVVGQIRFGLHLVEGTLNYSQSVIFKLAAKGKKPVRIE